MGPLKSAKNKTKNRMNKLAILGHSRVNPTVQRHAPKATDSHSCKAVYTAKIPDAEHTERPLMRRRICMNPVYGAVQLTLGSISTKTHLFI